MLADLLAGAGPGAVLSVFGLEAVLTAADDPGLWAAALARHWQSPQSPECHAPALVFGIGRLPAAGEAEEVVSDRSGLIKLAEWCFEREEGSRLRIVRCGAAPAMSFMSRMVTGGAAALAAPGASLVKLFLDISRPSVGVDRALVHSGSSMPPNAGSGETHFWQRGSDGTWTETGDLFWRWIS